MPGLEPESVSLAMCWCLTSEAGGLGSVAQGWSPWQHGKKLMTGPALTSTYNWWHWVAQHLYLQWPSQVLVMHSSRWRLLKPVKCLLSSSRAGEACLWPRGWVIMPLSGPSPERVQLFPLLWKSYPRETGNKCRHLTGHSPLESGGR